MEDQYGMGDLRQFICSRPLFPPIPQPPDLLSSHRGLNSGANPYDMFMFRSDSTTSAPSVSTVANINAGAAAAGAGGSSSGGGCFSGFESGLNGGGGGGDGGAGRWPRQETLTLLEIRSRLDSKFKEANQKGPLWDEVSRIMSEEHGYQRSGKKCREKFENLYKYYKKTKEGKAGRQDGKHYRFFRQLEALYGDNNNSNNINNNNNSNTLMSEPHQLNSTTCNQYNYPSLPNSTQLEPSLSLSNYSDANTTSSNNSGSDDDDLDKARGKMGNNWKAKIRDFIDSQMKKLIDKQESWMEKMMRTIEHKEQERISREEEWRKQDLDRIESERRFWAGERAWIEARDAALMDALKKLTGKETRAPPEMWPENEVDRLIEIRASMEEKFERVINNRGAKSEEEAFLLWEEISNKMSCLGHDRSAMMCKEKWDSVSDYVIKCNKKRKEMYYQRGGDNYGDNIEQLGNDVDDHRVRVSDHGNSSPNNNNNNNNDYSNGNNALNESCFRYFLGDAYGRIMD